MTIHLTKSHFSRIKSRSVFSHEIGVLSIIIRGSCSSSGGGAHNRTSRRKSPHSRRRMHDRTLIGATYPVRSYVGVIHITSVVFLFSKKKKNKFYLGFSVVCELRVSPREPAGLLKNATEVAEGESRSVAFRYRGVY